MISESITALEYHLPTRSLSACTLMDLWLLANLQAGIGSSTVLTTELRLAANSRHWRSVENLVSSTGAACERAGGLVVMRGLSQLAILNGSDRTEHGRRPPASDSVIRMSNKQ